MRQDEGGRWLFVAHGTRLYNKDVSRFQDLRIRINGVWKATVYNTLTGGKEDIRQAIRGKYTEVYCRMYDYDSLLLWLEPTAGACCQSAAVNVRKVADEVKTIAMPVTMAYSLSEPNVLLLDQAEYRLDNGAWRPQEEILRLDDACREQLGWPSRKEKLAQPWVIPQEEITHSVTLRWRIQSDISADGIKLAIEDAERLRITWNGRAVNNTPDGWYVDKSIKTVALPPLKQGENILQAIIPFGKRTNVEWAYLLGDFGVDVNGRAVRIIAARKELAFGDITRQGLPFYGGNITYHVPITTEKGELTFRSSHYRGAMQSVSIDGSKAIPVIYPPYTAELGNVSAGKHILDINLYGHRRNSFGPVHLTDLEDRWIGPRAWRSEGEKWCYDYKICEEGILSTPMITQS